MKITRHCVYAKDIQRITGRSERYGRTLIKKIKKHFGKKPHQFVTVDEFADYAGIDVDVVRSYLID